MILCVSRQGRSQRRGAGLPKISDDKGLHWFFGNKYKYSTGLFVVLLSTVVRHWEGMIPIRLRPPVYAIVCPSSFYVSHQSWLFFLKNFGKGRGVGPQFFRGSPGGSCPLPPKNFTPHISLYL